MPCSRGRPHCRGASPSAPPHPCRRADASTAANSALSSVWATNSRWKRTKAVRSGVGSCRANPQNQRKLARSSRASVSFTSDKSYEIANKRALNRARGGQACSPFGAAWIERDGDQFSPSRSDQQSLQGIRTGGPGPHQIPAAPARSDAAPWPTPLSGDEV